MQDIEPFDRKKYGADPRFYNKGKSPEQDSSIWRDPLDVQPHLKRAKCGMCSNTMIANDRAPHYVNRPGETFDEYYCGCRGWD